MKQHQEIRMRRIFISASSDGLGFLAGEMLLKQGYRVVIHARNEVKALNVKKRVPGCEAVVIGDISTITGMKFVAWQVNDLGRFDAVIHYVALGCYEDGVLAEDGSPRSLQSMWWPHTC
jgi:NAD(P)-dependent dehydrogenase (short-subunit alcohol dehydrogenase family)